MAKNALNGLPRTPERILIVINDMASKIMLKRMFFKKLNNCEIIDIDTLLYPNISNLVTREIMLG